MFGAVCATMVAATAQVSGLLGRSLPEVRWAQWPQGTAVVVGGEGAPAATVFACYSSVPTQHRARGDASHLAALQQRLGPRGVRVVVVVAAEAELDPAWAPCAVAVPEEEELTAWLGADQGESFHVLVVDARGDVTYHGRLGEGLEDAVERTASGALRIADERQALQLRGTTSFDDLPREFMKDGLLALLRRSPRDGRAAGVLHALLMHIGDVPAARAQFDRQLAVLAGEGRALGVFADLVLRASPQPRALAEALAAPLQAAAKAAPHDVEIGLVLLRALVLAGHDRDVGRQVMRVRKLAEEARASCLEFAEILTHADQPAIHADLANRALARAAELQAPPRLLAVTRFLVARRCAGDEAAAQSVFAQYVEALPMRVSLNNDCWYLLTELPTMGRYDAFAVALAERMLEQREAMDYFEFDTVALAMFWAGRLADAVELQQQAIDKGGKDDPAYGERLQRYRAAAAAAPR